MNTDSLRREIIEVLRLFKYGAIGEKDESPTNETVLTDVTHALYRVTHKEDEDSESP